jgi:long-chain acyl-CoA synthetase
LSQADIDAAERLRMAERAAASPGVERWPNLVTMFLEIAARRGDRPFLWHKADGAWQSQSWAAVARQVAQVAEALRAGGLHPGDRVVLVSENRPEFCIADLGIMAAGGVTVPTYTSNTIADHRHILDNSGAVAVIVSGPKLARAVLQAAQASGACRLLVGMEPPKITQTGDVRVAQWHDWLAPHPGNVGAIRTAMAQVTRRDLACLIYTSGTGGAPRGVRQHHGAILHNVAGCIDIIRSDLAADDPETFLSFLPLSHAYEHTAGQFLPISLGGEIWYAESLDKLAANMAEVRPTIMVVVPRLFEVLRQRVLKSMEKQGGMAPRLLRLAQRVGQRSYATGSVALLDRPADWLVQRTVRAKIRARFGGRLKALVSGGAPLNPEVGLFFHAMGITLLQGYGQTESAPVISCNRPAGRIKMHTVGPPLKDTEVMIAEDGEIMVSGELVMHGYWNNPAETARVLRDGWLLTGDIGHIDEDGHIVITDRKKDIIVNDKGDNVAPQRVEGMLTVQPEIAQAMVYGDRRPYLVGVVVPDPEFAMEWAAANGVKVEALGASSEYARAVQAAVDRVNAGLGTVEKVRRVILADAPFTVANEQMTPSLKIRRHVLKMAYADRLDALYRA